MCVHFYYFNSVSKKQEVMFCHFKSNDSQSFIHLHLKDNHFSPYIEVHQSIAAPLLQNSRYALNNINNLFKNNTTSSLHLHFYWIFSYHLDDGYDAIVINESQSNQQNQQLIMVNISVYRNDVLDHETEINALQQIIQEPFE